MPWWAWVWAVVLVLASAGSVVLDLRDKEPSWYTTLGLCSSLCCAMFLLHHCGYVRLPARSILAPLVLVGLLYETWKEIWQDRDIDLLEKTLSTTLLMILFLPAVCLGLADGL